MKFTAPSVRAADVAHGSTDFTDRRYPGLVLRVSRSTLGVTRAWRIRRGDGWETVGYATEPPRRARGRGVLPLADVLRIYRAGDAAADDPAAGKVIALQTALDQALADAGLGISFEAFVGQYLERFSAKHHSPRYRADLRRLFAADPFRAWRGRAAASISQRDVVALLEEVVDRGAGVYANRILSALRRLFRWGVAKALVLRNPASEVAKPVRERSRERVLSDDELGALLLGLEARRAGELELGPIVADAILMMAATLQRCSEVAAMSWREVSGSWWTMPGSRTKSGKPHRVFLGPLAMGVLERRSPLRFRSRFVFPGGREDAIRAGAHLHPHTIGHRFRDVMRALKDPPAVDIRPTAHDLRRSGRTALSRLGVLPHVAERVLGHASKGLVAVYDLYTWDVEVEAAILKWDRHLTHLLGHTQARLTR